jgi:hypothetical protein
MIYICGRKVKVKTGTKSQTVNICASKNIHGEYDYVVRLRPPFISDETLLQQRFNSIEDLVRYLERQHFGSLEKTPVITLAGTTQSKPYLLPAAQAEAVTPSSQARAETPSRTSWETDAILAVEQAIDQLILEFIAFPYLHRVEHSIHCELFKILTSRKIFSRTYAMSRGVTQPIHKEWPEFVPRPDKGNRRGNFDLSITAPHRLKSCSFTEFREGGFDPALCEAAQFNLRNRPSAGLQSPPCRRSSHRSSRGRSKSLGVKNTFSRIFVGSSGTILVVHKFFSDGNTRFEPH